MAFDRALLITPIAFVAWSTLVFSLGSITEGGGICKSNKKFSEFHQQANFTEVCFFYANSVLLLIRMMNTSTAEHSRDRPMFTMYLIVLTINVLAGTSSLLYLRYNWGGLCEDSMGVVLPFTIWMEWLICVPLMAFISVLPDRVQKLERDDIVIIVSIALCIIFGFIMTTAKNLPGYFICLFFSFLFFFVAYYVSFAPYDGGLRLFDWASHKESVVEIGKQLSAIDKIEKAVRQSRAKKLRILMLYVLPPFPILYILCIIRVLNYESTYLGLIVANVIAKFIFSSVSCDVHVVLVGQLFALLQAEVKANEERRSFLRFIFHEVRIPLNSIFLGLMALKDDGPIDVDRDDRKKAHDDVLLSMEEAAAFMSDTLNDVLSMQKIEDGGLELSMKPFSLKDMLSSIESTLKGSLKGKKINLVILLDEKLPDTVKGDKFRLEHVVINILSNAIKFSPNDSKIVLFAESGGDRDGSHGLVRNVRISIKDEGPGISEENLNDLFRPYYQIRPNDMQSGQGTGVGLALARNIVLLHGGDLTCTSKLGEGCNFVISLPLIYQTEGSGPGDGVRPRMSNTFRGPDSNRVHPDHDKGIAMGKECYIEEGRASEIVEGMTLESNSGDGESKTPYKSLSGGNIQIRSKTIITCLIVDDTPSNSKMLSMILAKAGIECSDFATNGEEAVHVVKANPGKFDVIFMDNTMPIMTGVEASRKLRQEEKYANLIIGLTGNALDDDIDAFVNAGADLVLSKPLRPAVFKEVLRYIATSGVVSKSESYLVLKDGNIECRNRAVKASILTKR